MKGKERKEVVARWMDSVTLVMGAPLDKPVDQIRDRLPWRKSVWLLRADVNLMAD